MGNSLEVRTCDPGQVEVPFALKIASVFIVICGVLGGVLCLSRGADFSIVVLIASIALSIAVFSVYHLFFRGSEVFLGKLDSRSFIVFVAACALLSILVEAGTLIGAACLTPLSLGDWNIKRIALYFFAAFLMGLFCLEYVPVDLGRRIGGLAKSTKSIHTFRVITCAGVLLAVSAVCSGVMRVAFGLQFFSTFCFSFSVLLALMLLAVRIKSPHILSIETAFLLFALMMGTSLIVAVPASNLFSWDDEVHYRNALRLSYLSDAEFTSSDVMMTKLFDVQPGHSMDASMGRWPIDFYATWTEADIDALNAELDAGYERGPIQVDDGINIDTVRYNQIGYLPSAAGLWFGRLLGLPFHSQFALGRFANLLSYCLVSFFAIKIIPCKKRLLAVLALIPTSLFMACNYAYDPWLISFGFLAIALLLRAMLDEEPLNAKSLFLIVFVFFLSLGPKAVYFPFIGLMFLMPAKKIPQSKRSGYYAVVVLFGLLVVLTFLAPLVASNGGGAGDIRSGANVNSSLQLRTVIADPIRYFSVFLNFLFSSYLTPIELVGGVANFAYLSNFASELPWLGGLVLLFIIFVAFTDYDERAGGIRSIGSVLWSLFLFAVTLFGICTALYLSFTAVGSDTIAGVQPRYLLPFYLPLFVFVLNFSVRIPIKRATYTTFVLTASFLLVSISWWLILFSRLYA